MNPEEFQQNQKTFNDIHNAKWNPINNPINNPIRKESEQRKLRETKAQAISDNKNQKEDTWDPTTLNGNVNSLVTNFKKHVGPDGYGHIFVGNYAKNPGNPLASAEEESHGGALSCGNLTATHAERLRTLDG